MMPYAGITLENFADWVEAGWTRKANTEQDKLRELAIMVFGLAGEVGEVIEPIKKEVRGDGPLDIGKLKLEIGDVLHYLCRIATEYNIDMGDVMRANIEKIEARRGKRAWEKTA
jgi:NTP pyrophosphatase (non-canonical NTP hydrolase)